MTLLSGTFFEGQIVLLIRTEGVSIQLYLVVDVNI
jgi:hypothetical protein